MEAIDPPPENGANLVLPPSPERLDPITLGVDEILTILTGTQNPLPTTSEEGFQSHHCDGRECAAGSSHPERLKVTAAKDNGAFGGVDACAASSAIENQAEDESGTFEHQRLLKEDSDGNLIFQDHDLGDNATEETPAQNYTCSEALNKLTQTQHHQPAETYLEGFRLDIDGSLTVLNQRLKENAIEETLTENLKLGNGIVEKTLTPNHTPEDAGIVGTFPSVDHNLEDGGMENALANNCQPAQDNIEPPLQTQNGHEQASINVSLELQDNLPEGVGIEDTVTQSCQPTQVAIEVVLTTHTDIPIETAIESPPTSLNHRLELSVTEEFLVSPQQETSVPSIEPSPVFLGKSNEKPSQEASQHPHSYEESAEPQKEMFLHEDVAPEVYLSQTLQQVLEHDGVESSDKGFTDSASTDNTLEDFTEFTSSPLVDNVVPESILTLPIHHDEDITADGWRGRRKHVFVLSEAGKPIYSRYGNEEALSSTMGVMMALVSFVQSGNNIIRSIYSGDHKVVFMQKGPLVLVSVSRTLQSEDQLRRELHYVYYQIISMLTQASIRRIFEHKKNYDLRRLLTGSEKILDSLLNLVEIDPSFLLGAVQCLPLAASVRDALNAILLKAITPNLVFSILLANGQLVTVVQEKAVIEDCRLDPTDLLLLLNLIRASSAFQAGEIWTPICLPRFNPDGYFYAYISYLDPECTVCLILLSTDKESFYSVSDCKKRIDENLRTHNLLQAIATARQSHFYSASIVGVPDLRHFMYKPLDIPENYKQLTQFTSPEAEGPYLDDEERQRLFDLYRYLHSRIHSSSRPLKLIYHVAEKETLLAWVTSKFELYTSYSPLVTKAGAINVITKLLRWIKKEEDRLFIRYPPKYSTTPVPGKSTKSGRGGADRIDASENGFFSGL
ncbi:uncharacterized protein [Ambystoma mexicanum]|uniref:uncharacterized protein n=1 Tax=Ambystoma mexicanum TaxID=8296 RepID=UPI0037E7895C